jgi:hypothetical protein
MRSLLLLVTLVAASVPSGASAYPTLVKHHYASCASCHVDPSGGGVLTAYGSTQNAQLLESRYGPPPAEEGEAPRKFLGFVPLPDWGRLAFSFRGGGFYTQTHNPAVGTPPSPVIRPIQMATDLRGALVIERFRASASLGFALRRAEPASQTPTVDGGENNIVSREHWIGMTFLDDALLVRGGRIPLPFGVRSAEHTLWVRALTRTDLNDQQQHGVAAAYNTDGFRAELMAIAGNFQIRPDVYRERGYSGFAEWAITEELAAGISSLIATSRRDLSGVEVSPVRQAHGVFARLGLGEQWVLLAEADALLSSAEAVPLSPGYAAWMQVDWEPVRGLHGIASLEAADTGSVGGSSLGAWLGVSWFATHGVELRLDALMRRIPVEGAQAVTQVSAIAQLHLNL